MRLKFVLLLMLALNFVSGQKNDYVWLQGYESNEPDDSAVIGFRLGNTILNFNYSTVAISYDSLPMGFDVTNTSFSNNDGQLQFYTNGIYVANALNEKIENGDSLNAGYVQYYWDPTIQKNGYRNPQGITALQKPGDSRKYYLIYSFTDTVPGSGGGNVYDTKTLSALLDMSANAGLGQVIYKNVPVIESVVGDEVMGVRHGNGRDWWILVQKRNSNCFYRILLDTSGIHLMQDLSCLGDSIGDEDIGAACFSPDGSKYVYLSYYGGLSIFDFDRCSGYLSNARYLPLPTLSESGWHGLGAAISSDSRFLYTSVTQELYQFDLSDSNIFSTIDTVGIYDGHKDPFGSLFAMAQLGPDGKIYMSCGNGEEDYHVINNPDSPRSACHFAQHSLQLPAVSTGLPTFPNYRLGALKGSACDTLSTMTEDVRADKERLLKVFPNPATDYITVDYGFTDWNRGPVNLDISNELGQIVYQQALPMYSGYQKIDLSLYSSGMYTASINRNKTVIATTKFVKE